MDTTLSQCTQKARANTTTMAIPRVGMSKAMASTQRLGRGDMFASRLVVATICTNVLRYLLLGAIKNKIKFITLFHDHCDVAA